jgi:ABC-type thiamin/hydroxymethylpyrimidine transport system permease subunit
MQLIFGGLISVILLGIYVHLIHVAVKVVYCVAPACTAYPSAYFNDGMAQALSVIGGLVSALVIAELAVAKPGEALVRGALAKDASTVAVNIVSIVATFYVIVWIGAGLTSFFVGLYHPKEVPQLTTLGQAWLGLAVSAAYAYFGIKPANNGT